MQNNDTATNLETFTSNYDSATTKWMEKHSVNTSNITFSSEKFQTNVITRQARIPRNFKNKNKAFRAFIESKNHILAMIASALDDSVSVQSLSDSVEQAGKDLGDSKDNQEMIGNLQLCHLHKVFF